MSAPPDSGPLPEQWGVVFVSAPCDVPMSARMRRLLKWARDLDLRCVWVGNSVQHPLVEPVELVEGDS